MAPAFEQDDKQPIKWMELPIMKFNEVAVPHHVNQLRLLKTNIQKCQRSGDWSGAHREQGKANVVVKQLRALVMEMDSLRSRVIDIDVSKFDKMINTSRQSAFNVLQEYIDLSGQLPLSPSDDHFHNNYSDDDDDIIMTGTGIIHDQLQQTLEISKLNSDCQDQGRVAIAWENLQRNIEEVQQLYQELAAIVETQEEAVTCIENNVEMTQELVNEGEKELQKAARLKLASYPFAGALIGSFMGGPVGVVAGFKMGSIVALACSLLGFTGGKFLRRKQSKQVIHDHKS